VPTGQNGVWVFVTMSGQIVEIQYSKVQKTLLSVLNITLKMEIDLQLHIKIPVLKHGDVDGGNLPRTATQGEQKCILQYTTC